DELAQVGGGLGGGQFRVAGDDGLDGAGVVDVGLGVDVVADSGADGLAQGVGQFRVQLGQELVVAGLGDGLVEGDVGGDERLGVADGVGGLALGQEDAQAGHVLVGAAAGGQAGGLDLQAAADLHGVRGGAGCDAAAD